MASQTKVTDFYRNSKIFTDRQPSKRLKINQEVSQVGHCRTKVFCTERPSTEFLKEKKLTLRSSTSNSEGSNQTRSVTPRSTLHLENTRKNKINADQEVSSFQFVNTNQHVDGIECSVQNQPNRKPRRDAERCTRSSSKNNKNITVTRYQATEGNDASVKKMLGDLVGRNLGEQVQITENIVNVERVTARLDDHDILQTPQKSPSKRSVSVTNQHTSKKRRKPEAEILTPPQTPVSSISTDQLNTSSSSGRTKVTARKRLQMKKDRVDPTTEAKSIKSREEVFSETFGKVLVRCVHLLHVQQIS